MCLMTGSVCHSDARRYQWFRRISPQKCSISVSSAGAGSNSKRTSCSSCSVGTSSGTEAAQVLHQHQRVLLLLEEPDRHEGREVAVVPVVAQEHLGGRQRRPLGDGVHLDGLRLLVGQEGGVEPVPGDVLVHVPADGLELLEKFGVEHGGSSTIARILSGGVTLARRLLQNGPCIRSLPHVSTPCTSGHPGRAAAGARRGAGSTRRPARPCCSSNFPGCRTKSRSRCASTPARCCWW